MDFMNRVELNTWIIERLSEAEGWLPPSVPMETVHHMRRLLADVALFPGDMDLTWDVLADWAEDVRLHLDKVPMFEARLELPALSADAMMRFFVDERDLLDEFTGTAGKYVAESGAHDVPVSELVESAVRDAMAEIVNEWFAALCREAMLSMKWLREEANLGRRGWGE